MNLFDGSDNMPGDPEQAGWDELHDAVSTYLLQPPSRIQDNLPSKLKSNVDLKDYKGNGNFVDEPTYTDAEDAA